MTMLIERNSSNTAMKSAGLVDIPCIIGGIRSYVFGKETEIEHCLAVEREIIGNISSIKWKCIFSDHNIAIATNCGSCDTRAIAPKIFFFLFCRSVWLFYIGAFFDTYSAVGVPFGLTVFRITIFYRFSWIIFTHPCVDMLDIYSNRFT